MEPGCNSTFEVVQLVGHGGTRKLLLQGTKCPNRSNGFQYVSNGFKPRFYVQATLPGTTRLIGNQCSSTWQLVETTRSRVSQRLLCLNRLWAKLNAAG